MTAGRIGVGRVPRTGGGGAAKTVKLGGSDGSVEAANLDRTTGRVGANLVGRAGARWRRTTDGQVRGGGEAGRLQSAVVPNLDPTASRKRRCECKDQKIMSSATFWEVCCVANLTPGENGGQSNCELCNRG